MSTIKTDANEAQSTAGPEATDARTDALVAELRQMQKQVADILGRPLPAQAQQRKPTRAA